MGGEGAGEPSWLLPEGRGSRECLMEMHRQGILGPGSRWSLGVVITIFQLRREN